jgi:2-polyprenyl-3-methyl-5-hydroxy-6-metoxy-1,4-benzoquinol methylase
MASQESAQEARLYWDKEAETFDQEPDHGLLDARVRAAWQELLENLLPAPPAGILDVGCGTGSLSVLLAEAGYEVTGIDFSPVMISQAKMKAQRAGQAISFQVMDAAFPSSFPQKYDVILCRHLLWALPEPARVLHNWSTLLAPNGRFLLIEGHWHTGGGLHAREIVDVLPATFSRIVVEDLSDKPALWGGGVRDERYLITAFLT